MEREGRWDEEREHGVDGGAVVEERAPRLD